MNTEKDNTPKTSQKKTPSLVEKIKNAKIFILAALFVLAIVINGVKKISVAVTGNMQDSYAAISNQDEPTFALFKDKLAEEGIKANVSEMSVFAMSEVSYKYKWQRGNDERVYIIRRNSQGIWDTYSQ